MPLLHPRTIAIARVKENIAALEHDGHSRAQSVAIAFNEARKEYFRRFPEGALPLWLAAKKGLRLAAHYSPDGAVLRTNPAPRQIVAAKRLYADFTGHEALESVRVNIPGARFKVGFIVGHALALELDFGTYRFAPNDAGGLPALTVSHDGREAAFVGGEFAPLADYITDEGLDNPKITAIMYRTVRDGVTENYRHPFATYAQPALLVHDARHARMIGGSFRFTDRGFVDVR